MKKILLFLLAFTASVIGVNAQSFEPKWAGTVTAIKIEGDSVSIPLEKANVQVKTASSTARLLTGIGAVRQKAVIKGGQSTTQLSPDAPVILIVKCKDNESDPTSFIQIFKFEEKKKERKTELANVNWIGNMSEGNMVIVPYEAETYGTSSYILTMQPQEGEFGLRILNPNVKDEKVTIFHCFGIHQPEN